MDAHAPRFPRERHVGPAFGRCYERRIDDGFMAKYFSGEHVLDIGYQGGDPDALPIVEWAIGIGLDYPGYDGTHMPFADRSQDTILASHVLEHILNYREALTEWYRLLKVGGYLVLLLPHRYLFERRPDIPSLRSDHCRFYTSTSLLAELDESLPINGFRIRHLRESDEGYNYHDPFSAGPYGNYEIELVVEKIERPDYSDNLVWSAAMQDMVDNFDRLVFGAVTAILDGEPGVELFRQVVGGSRYFTPWDRLRQHFLARRPSGPGDRTVTEAELKAAVRPLLEFGEIDAASYLALHRDLAGHPDPAEHWRVVGYFEGRAMRDLGLIAHDIARGAAPVNGGK